MHALDETRSNGGISCLGAPRILLIEKRRRENDRPLLIQIMVLLTLLHVHVRSYTEAAIRAYICACAFVHASF